jgi:hypothetical protein
MPSNSIVFISSFVEGGAHIRRQHGDLAAYIASLRKGSRLTVRLTNSGLTIKNTDSSNDGLINEFKHSSQID